MATKDIASKKGFKETAPEFRFAFGKENYIWMTVGVVLLIFGYILLVGGGSSNPNEFNYALFNTRRLVISPIIIVGGLVIEVYAIMKNPKQNKQNSH